MTDQLKQLLPGLDVSRETEERLQAYEALVREWSPKINLVSQSSLTQFRTRHVLDCAQLLPLADHPVRHLADLGSGAGLPGVVIAILMQEMSPATRISLVESDRRKATFLQTCARRLQLPINIVCDRIEAVAPLEADIVTARALAPLDRLLPLVRRHLAETGCALLPKGKSAQSEIDEARKVWHFTATAIASQTDASAHILRIERITRA